MVNTGDPSTGAGHVTKIRGLKETPAQLALRALRSITKSTNSALQLTNIPNELLFGEKIDFHRWSLVIKDDDLVTLSQQGKEEHPKEYFLDCSSPTISGMFHAFWEKLRCSLGLLELNIANSKDISDYGLTIIARASPELRKLCVAGCSLLTDIGLREVAMNCKKLQSLNLSLCPLIEGPGIIAVAENCLYLSKLNLVKNSHIKNYSLQKLFRKCSHLEEVYLSYLKDITDDETRILAENCPDLQVVEAIECLYLSDQTILGLSQNCKDLDAIDFTRSQMNYRISDITLMALGQRSFSLRSVRLNNCDSITDVGLGWLAAGCKVVETIELNGCNKVTDAGLRVLGAECHALTAFDISQARSVTDIGLSTLSRGCRGLKLLKIPNAVYISDPRFTPVDGDKLELWEELIGIPALATYCPNLEVLDVSGCFRVNKVFGQYISRLKNLKNLNIKACNQVTPPSLIALAMGCTNLEELNLSDCGKAINNEVMMAFSKNCSKLRVLQVCRCLEIQAMGIKAISNMKRLERLSLSGCASLTDAMLVHLAGLEKVPLLVELDLTAIPKLTDSSIAWISMKDHKILTINMKGSAISSKALMSVRDRFPNSEVLINESFMGFTPKYRVQDRMMINSYYRVINGMTKIQSRYRKFKAIQRVLNIQEERRRIAAHALIQRIGRGFLGRRRVKHLFANRLRMRRAAIMITSVFRVAVAKKVVLRIRLENLRKWRNACAGRIQRAFRCYRARVALANLRLEKLRAFQRRVRATIKIQSVARMYLTNCRIFNMKALRRARERVKQIKANMIQRLFRGKVARKHVKEIKVAIAKEKHLRECAARVIQKKFRVFCTKKIVIVMHSKRTRREDAAVVIQALMRGALARLYVFEMLYEYRETRKRNAALAIQCRWRVYKARCEFFRNLKTRAANRQVRDSAANVIIGAARMKLAWMGFTNRRKEYLERLRTQADIALKAAIKIQSVMRRYLGRVAYYKKRDEKKFKWKELYDEEKKRRFFYNKLTGEIRWRIPQDLLDLIPHPSCDNCACSEAALECRVCNELFCGSCFQTVHAGGRRKDHEYRALYDFYGRRLDFGDGEFPCQWPSDVIQDEIQGWMLRVAPHRPPMRVFKESGWEEYSVEEEDSGPKSMLGKAAEQIRIQKSMGGNAPKIFYFNRKTFETSYEVPEGVRAELKAKEDAERAKQEKEAAEAAVALQFYQKFYQQLPQSAGGEFSGQGYYDPTGTWVWYDQQHGSGASDGLQPPRRASTSGTDSFRANHSSKASPTPANHMFSGLPSNSQMSSQRQQQQQQYNGYSNDTAMVSGGFYESNADRSSRKGHSYHTAPRSAFNSSAGLEAARSEDYYSYQQQQGTGGTTASYKQNEAFELDDRFSEDSGGSDSREKENGSESASETDYDYTDFV